MIVAIMAYATAIGVIAAVVGVLTERVLARAGAARRWAYVGAAVLMLALPAVGIVYQPLDRLATASTAVSGASAALPLSVQPRPRRQLAHRVERLTTIVVTSPRPAWRALVSALVAPRPRVHRMLGVMWGLASSLLLLRLGLVANRLRRTPSIAAPPELADDGIVVTRSLGPAAFGVVRARMFLPRWVLELPADERDLVLRHEREHVREKDPQLLFVCATLTALLPWHLPLLWCARRLRVAMELDCDARVIRSGVCRAAYAHLLVRLSGERATRRRRVRMRDVFSLELGTMATMAASEGVLAQRVRALTSGGERRRGAALVPALVALVLTTGALSIPAPSLARDAAPALFAAPADRRGPSASMAGAPDAPTALVVIESVDGAPLAITVTPRDSAQIALAPAITSEQGIGSAMRSAREYTSDPIHGTTPVTLRAGAMRGWLRVTTRGTRQFRLVATYPGGMRVTSNGTASLLTLDPSASGVAGDSLVYANPPSSVQGVLKLSPLVVRPPQMDSAWRSSGMPPMRMSTPLAVGDPPRRSTDSLTSNGSATATIAASSSMPVSARISLTAADLSDASEFLVAMFVTDPETPSRAERAAHTSIDTVRVTGMATVTRGLMGGELHLVRLDGAPMRATAVLEHGRALTLTGTGSHVVLKRAGTGVRIDPYSSRE